ncbi:MAG: hypothetical protein WD267_04280 [Balneolales bacterium]
MMRFLPVLLLVLFIYPFAEVVAQNDPFGIPQFEKVTTADRTAFQNRFRDVKWTGEGFRGNVVIDQIPTSEIRARLEQVFGPPTQKVDHLMERENFRPGHYIQFEYWFVINDNIPLMILDVDGPFSNGLVFGGASRYIDLMPEIKRTLSNILMEEDELGEYEDYYFDLDERIWYRVEYKNGAFSQNEISEPRW